MILSLLLTLNIDNTATRVKSEVFYEYSITKSSTYLNNTYLASSNDFILSTWKKENIFSSDLSLENLGEYNNSTWEETDLIGFDLFADVYYNKVIKVKSKIKSVTKYKPNIIID